MNLFTPLFQKLKSGAYIIPRGSIIMWSGTIANIPVGWTFCNGLNGTPDLRNRFIVCANQDSGAAAYTTIEGPLQITGGSISHQHYISFYTDSAQDYLQSGSDIASAGGSWYWSYLTNGHQHTINGYSDFTTTLPPYYALAYIMKT